MITIKNATGCTVNIAVKLANEYSTMFAKNGTMDFANAITHKLLDVVFEEGRKIYIQICGSRSLNIPKKCKTLQDIAEWINGKDF